MSKNLKIVESNPLIDHYNETFKGDTSFDTFEFTENLMKLAIDSPMKDVEELYQHITKENNNRTVKLSKEIKEQYRNFFVHPARIAAYDATQWKKVEAIVEFIDSDSTECSNFVFAEMITFISQSKFVSVQGVMDVALPVNKLFEPLAMTDSRYHQLIRLIADIYSKKVQEVEQKMEFTQSDWSNSLMIAKSVMKFPIDAVESL